MHISAAYPFVKMAGRRFFAPSSGKCANFAWSGMYMLHKAFFSRWACFFKFHKSQWIFHECLAYLFAWWYINLI